MVAPLNKPRPRRRWWLAMQGPARHPIFINRRGIEYCNIRVEMEMGSRASLRLMAARDHVHVRMWHLHLLPRACTGTCHARYTPCAGSHLHPAASQTTHYYTLHKRLLIAHCWLRARVPSVGRWLFLSSCLLSRAHVWSGRQHGRATTVATRQTTGGPDTSQRLCLWPRRHGCACGLRPARSARLPLRLCCGGAPTLATSSTAS